MRYLKKVSFFIGKSFYMSNYIVDGNRGGL